MKAVNVDEVLKILYKYGQDIFVTDYKKYREMQDEIANLKALEPEPCEDCVSREAVEDAIADMNVDGQRIGYSVAYEILSDLPPVTPQPKIGHWIRWYEQKEDDWCIENISHCKCSECGKEYDSHSSQFIKYCSECGAKMQEVEE